MKRIVVVILIACLVFACITSNSFAEEGKKSGLFSYELKGNGNAVITGFDWEANGHSDIYIPRQVDGYNVSEIGAYAFSAEEIGIYDTIGYPVVVVIPETITMIGEKAFFGSEITSVNIPSSVQFIGSGALAYCQNINQFTVDGSNETFATIDGVLYNKTSKELIAVPYARYNKYENIFEIPEGITTIGDYAFYGLELKGAEYMAQGVKLPSSLVRIGNHAFEYVNFSGSYGSLQFGYKASTFNFNNVKAVGSYAFAHVKSKMTWNFGMLETIGDYAFSSVECNDRKENWKEEVFTLPSTVKSIGIGAFSNYKEDQGIKTIDLSSTQLTEIPNYAFSNFQLRLSQSYVNDSQYREIKLPDSISSIGAYAFEKIGTEELGDHLYYHGVYITFPPSVQTIKEHAFDMASVIPTFSEGLKTIEDGAFYDSCLFCEDTTLNLPDGIQTIGKESFYANYLDSLYIPDSVSSIGEDVCDRSTTKLVIEPNSYAALYASENGYAVVNSGGDDTSWLNN